MKNGKPSVDEIKELTTKCEEKYGELYEKFDEDEKYYELDFKEKLGLPEEFYSDGIVLPTARDMVDTFVDHIDINNARVFVNKKGIYQTSEEQAELMRKFFLGIIHQTNVNSDISPWRVAAKHYALHGLAVFKTVWDADRWPDKPERGEGESEKAYAERIDEWRHDTHQSIPIVIQAVHPRCIIPDPAYSGRQFVIEKHKRLCLDISKRWPHWKNPKGKQAKDDVEFLSYWDDTFRCDLADGEPLLKVRGGVAKHNYGFLPYTLIDSGLGNISIDSEPKMRYVGLLRYMFDMLISESRVYSIDDIVLKKSGFPYMVVSGKNARLVTEITQKYGMVNVLPEDVTIEERVPQTPSNMVMEHYYRTADAIAAHAAPRSLRGLPESGVRSAAHMRQSIAEGAARYQYSEQSFKHGTAQVLINCARLFKNVIPGDIRVWARTPTDEFDVEISKNKIKEPFTCFVEFAPQSEEDEYRRHDDLERLVSSGIYTIKQARKRISDVDVAALEEDEEIQRLKNSPMIQQILDQYLGGKLAQAIQARGMAEGMTEGIMPVGGQQPAQPMPTGEMEAGRQMIPPVPNRAQLGSAEALQNMLQQLRSQTPMNATQGRGVNAGGFKP